MRTSVACTVRMGRAAAILLLVTALVASGCDRLPLQQNLVVPTPEQLDDGWEVSTLDAEGLDASIIAEVGEELKGQRYGAIHSCLIVKNGALVYEHYSHIRRREAPHRLYSVTKSVTSALVGIALEQGFIDDLDRQVITYFPEYVDEEWNHDKDAITLRHLLTMSAGLQYDENAYRYGDPRNSYTQMTRSDDWMKWTLDQPLVAEPGTRFAYNSGCSHLFSGILFKTTGEYADKFAEKHLFAPLGITNTFWINGNGFPATSGAVGGLSLRPRDMAKIGQMYLNGGRWKGVQVVPEKWVAESFVPRIQAWGDWQYGYQWWMRSDRISGQQIDSFAARGYGDQYIVLFPSLDMVVVITGGNEGRSYAVESAIQTIARAALSQRQSGGQR